MSISGFMRHLGAVALVACASTTLFAGEMILQADLEREIAFGYKDTEVSEDVQLKLGAWEMPPSSGEKYVRMGNSFNYKEIFLLVRFDLAALSGKRVSSAGLVLTQTDITRGDHHIDIAVHQGAHEGGEWVLDDAALKSPATIEVLRTSSDNNGRTLEIDVSNAVQEAVRMGQSTITLEIRDATANSRPESEDYIDLATELSLKLSVLP